MNENDQWINDFLQVNVYRVHVTHYNTLWVYYFIAPGINLFQNTLHHNDIIAYFSVLANHRSGGRSIESNDQSSPTP